MLPFRKLGSMLGNYYPCLIFLSFIVEYSLCGDDLPHELLEELINTRSDFIIPVAKDHVSHSKQFLQEQSNVKRYPFRSPVSASVPLETGDNSILILHRGDRVWDQDTFDENDSYQKQSMGPIPDGVLVHVDQMGTIKSVHLPDRFHLPHGLTVDPKGNIWITDVAMHQVFKFGPPLDGEPLLTLGQKFVPGDDELHFCKPTHVVVALNGDFFVADGYCNNRILKFNSTGHLIKQWGQKTIDKSNPQTNELNVPHQLAIIEERDLLCVADRENRRVICYVAGLSNMSSTRTGEFVFQLSEQGDLFGAVYGVAYSPQQQNIVVLFNEGLMRQVGFIRIYDLETLEYVGSISEPYEQPHTISTCQTRIGESCILVSDLGYSGPNSTGYVWYYSSN